MPRFREATTSFVAGELSPLMAARGDTKIYRNGAAKLTNRAPLVEGGTRTRPGLLHVVDLAATGTVFKAAEFVFSKTQAYAAIFTDGRLDIFAHPAAAGASPAATLAGCPWTAAMVQTLAITQSDDTMIVFHPDMRTQVVKRTGASSFTRGNFAFEENAGATKMFQPYYKFAEPPVTLAASGTSGVGVTFTASAPVFAANHVGAIIRKDKKEILVTGYTSPTVVTGTCRETVTIAATADWDEAVASAARGYFSSGTFHLDRLVLAGAKSRPSGIYVSKVGAYFNFDLGTGLDNEGIWDSVKDEKVAELRQILSADALLVWSDAATFAYFATTAAPFTPKNFEMKKQAPFGVADGVRPVEFDEGNIFVQASGAIVREAIYSDADQKFKSTPVSQIASHLIASPTALAVLYGAPGRPEQLALAVNGDGRLSVFHSLRRESIAAWFDWATAGKFKAICTVVDTVYVVVERSIFGGTKYCLERFDDTAAALDCQRKATSGSATKTFAALVPHLEGLEVSVVSKGHSLGRVTVGSGGSVTLGDLAPEVTEIEVGLPFEQRIRPMPVHVDLGDGSGRGLVQGVARMLIVVDRAAGFRVAGQDILLDFQGDDYANPAPTKTGTVEVRLLGYDREGVRDIVVPDGAKTTILSVTRDVLVSTG
jgi:hypothetical protein